MDGGGATVEAVADERWSVKGGQAVRSVHRTIYCNVVFFNEGVFRQRCVSILGVPLVCNNIKTLHNNHGSGVRLIWRSYIRCAYEGVHHLELYHSLFSVRTNGQPLSVANDISCVPYLLLSVWSSGQRCGSHAFHGYVHFERSKSFGIISMFLRIKDSSTLL